MSSSWGSTLRFKQGTYPLPNDWLMCEQGSFFPYDLCQIISIYSYLGRFTMRYVYGKSKQFSYKDFLTPLIEYTSTSISIWVSCGVLFMRMRCSNFSFGPGAHAFFVFHSFPRPHEYQGTLKDALNIEWAIHQQSTDPIAHSQERKNGSLSASFRWAGYSGKESFLFLVVSLLIARHVALLLPIFTSLPYQLSRGRSTNP